MPRRRASTPKTHRFLIIRIFGANTGRIEQASRPKCARFSGSNVMPQIPITMPQLGESMAEATIVSIKVKPRDKVVADQEIIEVETDKAVMGVTTPCAGEIAKIEAEVKGTYPVGAVLGYVEASEVDAARFQKRAPEQPKGDVAKEIPGRQEETVAKSGNGSAAGSHFQVDDVDLPQVAITAEAGRGGLPVPASAKGAGYLSPRVRARMA